MYRIAKLRAVFVVALMSLAFAACTATPPHTSDTTSGLQTGVSEMTPKEALPYVQAAYSQFIDVRTVEEYAEGHAARTRNIPLDTLAANLDMIEKNEPVFLICRSGVRSLAAAKILVDNGFPQAISVSGGTNEWKEEGLPMGE